MDLGVSLILIIVAIICVTGSLEYGMPLHDNNYIEGKINSVSISRSSTLYNFENESFEIKYLPEEVKLHTLCRVHYGTTFLFQEVTFISIEYLEW